MGQKTHPIGFRLGGVKDWQAHWFAAKASDYRALTLEDLTIRRAIQERYGDSGSIARVEIERGPQDLVVTINTARPGIIIGRGGQRVDELRGDLERLTGKRARLNIQEMRQPELDAHLVGRNIAEQLERRIAYRRAMRLTMQRTMQAGAKGIKVKVSGRLGGAEIARTDGAMEGRIPLHTLRADVDFAISEARTTFGQVGVKVWIYKGDVMATDEAIRARALERMTVGSGGSGSSTGRSGPPAGRGGRGRGRPAGPQPGRRERPDVAQSAGPPSAGPEGVIPTEPEDRALVEPQVVAPSDPEGRAPAEPQVVAPSDLESKAPAEPEAVTPTELEAGAPASTESEAPAPPKKRAAPRPRKAAADKTVKPSTRSRRKATPAEADATVASEEGATPAEEELKPDAAGSTES